MGNCIRHQSSTGSATDDDDEWDEFAAAEEGGSFAAPNGGKKRTTEVKIKITKKQLEELVGKVDVKELRVEEVLAQLMKHRPWRPALQSIPED
ncbi:uncharacterized protein LOC113848246 [Abrus precatorius]|uniref:Uncharacterized protein LOC113848246 n=1 Tax=Abrus precatorius TaxID=3816 RepID=A0A8B8JPU6_ABRPR|nr:uncharacterized protein LOC113848246 [Abrus precatorius]